MNILKNDERIKFNNYINHLNQNFNLDLEVPTNFNVYISGGGMASNYCVGFLGYMSNLIQSNKIRIDKIAGTSSGAYVATLSMGFINQMKIDVDTFREEYLKYYQMQQTKSTDLIDSIYDNLYNGLDNKIIPKFNDRLFINATEVNYLIPREKVFSKFESREDLINILKCSSCVPYITKNGLFHTYNGKKYIDGIIVPDELNKLFNNDLPILFINLYSHDMNNFIILNGKIVSYISDFISDTFDLNEIISDLRFFVNKL